VKVLFFDFRSVETGLPSVVGPAPEDAPVDELEETPPDAAAALGSDVMRSISVIPDESCPDAIVPLLFCLSSPSLRGNARRDRAGTSIQHNNGLNWGVRGGGEKWENGRTENKLKGKRPEILCYQVEKEKKEENILNLLDDIFMCLIKVINN
jgi:hypothetical protein